MYSVAIRSQAIFEQSPVVTLVTAICCDHMVCIGVTTSSPSLQPQMDQSLYTFPYVCEEYSGVVLFPDHFSPHRENGLVNGLFRSHSRRRNVGGQSGCVALVT